MCQLRVPISEHFYLLDSAQFLRWLNLLAKKSEMCIQCTSKTLELCSLSRQEKWNNCHILSSAVTLTFLLHNTRNIGGLPGFPPRGGVRGHARLGFTLEHWNTLSSTLLMHAALQIEALFPRAALRVGSSLSPCSAISRRFYV